DTSCQFGMTKRGFFNGLNIPILMKTERYRGFGGSGFEFFVAQETNRMMKDAISVGGVFLAVFPESRLDDAAQNIRTFCDYLSVRAEVSVFPSEDSWRRLGVYARLVEADYQWRRKRPVADGRARPVIVASVEALAEAAPRAYDFARGTFVLRVGGVARALAGFLVANGYKRVDYAQNPGEFAVRGQITDFWSPCSDSPVRAVFDGDLVERLRFFDPSEQITTADAAEARVVPALERRGARRAADEWFSRPRAVFSSLDVYPSAAGAAPCVDFAGLVSEMRPDLFISNEPFAAPMSDEVVGDAGFLSVSFCGGDGGALERDIASLGAAGLMSPAAGRGALKKILFAPTDGEAARFGELCAVSQALRDCDFEVVSGKISEGFAYPSGKLFVISAAQFFLRSAARIPPKIKSPSIRAEGVWEIADGDFVVHERYGVGMYRGMVALDDPPQEFLRVEYKRGDTIYVPVYEFARIKKYVGVEGVRPKISDLDAPGIWERARERSKRSAEVFAAELLKLYAERERISAPAMEAETVWEAELEQSFPFEETADQAAAIKETLADLSRPRPADRVILGDVGFGKTEVALRAAFKTAVNSYQTALIVPTTILSMQHYTRFVERLAPFPVKVAALHRFQTKAEQRNVVEGVASGAVDILIGTHRILSKDIRFKNIGLLIIDEEHRFGVRQKEKLRRFAKNVHTLLMSATPIPRTLGAALNGIKDISIIETPPVGRKPVETLVAPRSSALARSAILNELARGGQVFYVHNVIKDIPRLLVEISSETPQARWGVIHGRMTAVAVEKTLFDFYSGKIDCLLSTTIVESGLDIPQVNTMIIAGAQNFGLAQLYQLRGRVGRGDRKAYCYLFYDDKDLSQDAARRLEALREFSTLGSGWRLARRDMEIRGAGALFGYRQHGFLAAVGFDLYAKLISEAVKAQARRAPESVIRPSTLSIEPVVNLHLDARIPPDYVADDTLRISFYRRFVTADDEADVSSARAALADRFGPLPPEVSEVSAAAMLRLFMKRNLVLSISSLSGGETSIEFAHGVCLTDTGIKGLLGVFGSRIRFAGAENFGNTIIIGGGAVRKASDARSLLEKVIKFATIRPVLSGETR
ncbi:MAG: helicase-related protein, partial [Endomicrobiia bacterium]|nr:helicase-related protein [Endomicrobiia bacterium]